MIEGYTEPADHSERVANIEVAGFVVDTETVKNIDFEEDIAIGRRTGTEDYIVVAGAKEIADSSEMSAVDIVEDFVHAVAYVVGVVDTGNKNIADEEGTFQDFASGDFELYSLAFVSVAPHKICSSDNPCYPFSSYWDPFYRIIVKLILKFGNKTKNYNSNYILHQKLSRIQENKE